MHVTRTWSPRRPETTCLLPATATRPSKMPRTATQEQGWGHTGRGTVARGTGVGALGRQRSPPRPHPCSYRAPCRSGHGVKGTGRSRPVGLAMDEGQASELPQPDEKAGPRPQGTWAALGESCKGTGIRQALGTGPGDRQAPRGRRHPCHALRDLHGRPSLTTRTSARTARTHDGVGRAQGGHNPDSCWGHGQQEPRSSLGREEAGGHLGRHRWLLTNALTTQPSKHVRGVSPRERDPCPRKGCTRATGGCVHSGPDVEERRKEPGSDLEGRQQDGDSTRL